MRKSGVLKFLFILTAVVLIAQQILNYIYIKRLDKQYSDIITDKLEISRSFEFVANQSAALQHAIVHLLRYDGKDYDSVKKQIGQGSSNMENLLAKMKKHAVSEGENESIDSLSVVFGTYMGKCNSDLVILKSEKVDSVISSRLITDLRETYSDFISMQLKESGIFIGNGERVSDEITANTNKTSALLLAVGILPFIVLSLVSVLAAFTLLVIGYSVNWFKDLE